MAPATFTVNSLADLSLAAGVNAATGAINGTNTVTLRSALRAANLTPGGNTIDLALPGTYKITLAGTAGETDNAAGEFAILPTGGNLTIQNTSGGSVVVDGNHLNRVFDINPNFDPANPTPSFLVSFAGFTIQNGVATDGNNPDGPTASGGGIRDQGNASLTLNNVLVTNNVASADGGGISFENTVSAPWTLTVNNSTISNNHAGDAGGGVDEDGSGKIFITNSTISGNTTVNQGGGVWLDAIQVGNDFQTANLTVTGSILSGNVALTGVGGSIGNAGNGAVTITSTTDENNSSGGGGGGFGDENAQGALVVQNSLFLENSTIGNGGGIAAGGPTTTITYTEIQDNSSSGFGGGLLANGVTLTLLDSTIVGNTASFGGGGIELQTTGGGATGSTITDSTITGNSAVFAPSFTVGGGIDASVQFGGSLLLLNDTITANFATFGGGGLFLPGDPTITVSVQNTILAENSAGAGPDVNNIRSSFTDLGGNLIGNAAGSTGFTASTTQTGTSANPIDPRLGPLGNYGGPTVGAPTASAILLTEALLPGSPAIGKGVPTGAPTTDERGFARLSTTDDVGAVTAFTPPTGAIPPGPRFTAGGGEVINVISTADNNGPVITAGHAGTAADPFLAPSLRSAITFANSTPGADTINLTVAGDYKITRIGAPGETDNLAGEFAILPAGGNLTIQNTSGGAVILDGNHLNRVLDVNPANTNNPATKILVTLQGLTVTNGVAFDANNPDGATSSGGGIRDQGNASLTLNNVIVANNVANADGGGIVFENTVSTPWTLTVNNSTISNNHAGDAGGGIDEDGSGQIFITNSTISGNTSVNQGGGVWLDAIQAGNVLQTANLTVTGSVISGNFAQTGVGGGIGNAGNGAVSISSSTVEYNFSGNNGGGFGDDSVQGTLIVENSLFLGNTSAEEGGGIETFGPTTTITSTEIKGNSSQIVGGGVFADGVTLTLLDDTLADNTSENNGGGIQLETSGIGVAKSTITNAAITGNSSLNDMGGGTGGGISMTSGGSVVLQNDTITGNFAGAAGGVAWFDFGTPFLVQNTIIAGNITDVADPDAFSQPGSTFTDLGGNLIGNATGSAGFTTATTQRGTLANPIDPLLGPLGNYGGPTVGAPGAAIVLQTEALLPGSPAIDAAINDVVPDSTDERGFLRVVGLTVDIGADEYQYDLLASATAPASVLPGGTIAYTLTVTNNGPDSVTTVLTDTLPAGTTFVSFTAFEPANVSALGAGQTGTVTATTPLAAGASASFTLVVLVAPGTIPGTITNTAAFGPVTDDVNPANNTASSTTVLIGPSGTITTDRPTFTWLAVKGATSYDLYVTDQTTPSNPPLFITGLSGTSYQLTTAQALTPGHAYLWYLGSVANGKTTFGSPTSFTIAALAAPTQIGPVNTTILAASGYDTPTFSWIGVAGTNRYWLYVVAATNGSVVINNNNVSGTSFTSQALTPGHSYTWYIAAVSNNGAAFTASGPRSFSLAGLAAPVQNGPSGTIAATAGYDTPTFRWNPVTGASQYYLYVVDATTGAVAINNATIPTTSFTASAGLTPGHSFTWYIAAEGANGGGASFSGPKSFSLAALTAPMQNGPGGTIAAVAGYDTPTFRWTAVAGTNRYWLYVVDATLGSAVINNNNVSGTSFTPLTSQALTPGHSYTWYIAAVGANGAYTASGPQTFTLASVQLGPSNNSTIAHTAGYLSPTFTWVAAAQAVSYDLVLVDVTNPKSNQQPILFNKNVGNVTSFPLPLTLTGGHRYQWYVGIVTSSGVVFWDGAFTFTLAP